MGKARCATFTARFNGTSVSNGPDRVNLDYLQSLEQLCSLSDPNATLADLDHMTPATFDNQYYVNLLSGEGLLGSDQALVAGEGETRGIVEMYADDLDAFFQGFKMAMLRMGSMVAGDGGAGEIRRNCRVVNQIQS